MTINDKYLIIFFDDKNNFFTQGIKEILKIGLEIHNVSFLLTDDSYFHSQADITIMSIDKWNRNNSEEIKVQWFYHLYNGTRHLVGEFTFDRLVSCTKFWSMLNEMLSKEPTPLRLADECPKLSETEALIMRQLASGIPQSVIAKNMNCSAKTISAHKRNVMKKFNISTPLQLFFWMKQGGLIQNHVSM